MTVAKGDEGGDEFGDVSLYVVAAAAAAAVEVVVVCYGAERLGEVKRTFPLIFP